ncbi:MAG TPA: FAD binding domain-containing protein [Planctomycetota bacterium]|nr:FAD binding domain-containing protein [Planctomycetota bacterium]
MKAFAYLTADGFEAASRALAGKGPRAVAKAGGTDLLPLLKSRLFEPDEVVNLQRIRSDGRNGELGALATLAEVAAAAWVREDFPAVAKAAGEAATPQIRNAGTVGGNLCQHTRCWYFRDANYTCHKRGTGDCSAAPDGAQNRYHAIFPHKRCVSAHPSNLAPALIAVGAKVICVHPDGDRTVDVELLYDEGPKGRTSDTILREGELIRAVVLEPTPLAKRSTYVELRERQSFDFALASVAAAIELDGDVVKDVRIAFGGVAPIPCRAKAAENAIRGKKLDVDAAARAAVAGATPLSDNAYKVPVLKELVRRALTELAS